MDARDWRVRLLTRYMRGFENGDLAEIDAILGPNFHEMIEGRDEIDRLGQMDHLRRLIESTADRRAELSNFIEQDGDICATLKLQFEIGRQTWMVDARLLCSFEDRLIDHVTSFNTDIRCLEPMLDGHAPHK
jgi:hypothetical protein